MTAPGACIDDRRTEACVAALGELQRRLLDLGVESSLGRARRGAPLLFIPIGPQHLASVSYFVSSREYHIISPAYYWGSPPRIEDFRPVDAAAAYLMREREHGYGEPARAGAASGAGTGGVR